MNLVIDIGNTSTKTALFQGSKLMFSSRYLIFGPEELSTLLSEYRIEGIIVCNTGKVTDALKALLNTLKRVLFFDFKSKLPIINAYETPATLGKDRLAAAVGAWIYFNKKNSIIIDMGTCITMDFLDAGGHYRGGNISPGIKMRLRAMHEFTASLPMVEVAYTEELFGDDTISAMQNGGVKGTFYEIESFIVEVKAKYESINVILTGGDAEYFEKFTKNEIFVAPYLVLEGLNEILKHNAD